MRSSDSERTSDVTNGTDDESDNWDFERWFTAKKIALIGIRGNLRDVHHVCAEGGEAVPTTIANKIELAHEGIELKRKNATISKLKTDLEAQMVEMTSGGRLLRGPITAKENCVKALKSS